MTRPIKRLLKMARVHESKRGIWLGREYATKLRKQADHLIYLLRRRGVTVARTGKGAWIGNHPICQPKYREETGSTPADGSKKEL